MCTIFFVYIYIYIYIRIYVCITTTLLEGEPRPNVRENFQGVSEGALKMQANMFKAFFLTVPKTDT